MTLLAIVLKTCSNQLPGALPLDVYSIRQTPIYIIAYLFISVKLSLVI